jgi:hypothetical protein
MAGIYSIRNKMGLKFRVDFYLVSELCCSHQEAQDRKVSATQAGPKETIERDIISMDIISIKKRKSVGRYSLLIRRQP